MSKETIARDVRMLRLYAESVEKALVTLPVGPVRNEAVAALAGVDQKIAEFEEGVDYVDG